MSTKVIIGLGCGRCGTLSLAQLFAYQPNVRATHEAFIFPWKMNKPEFRQNFESLRRGRMKIMKQHIEYANKPGNIISDTASWYLNYVPFLSNNYDAKFICLERDFDETVESWFAKAKVTWHFMETDCEHWQDEWPKEHKYRKGFPHYNLNKRDSLAQYIKDYYEKARSYEKIHANFRIFPIDMLNSKEGINKILNFAGINNKNTKTGIKLNVRGTRR
jgi:hypothetical protein